MTDKKNAADKRAVKIDADIAVSNRRNAVKNILAGSTLAAGAATSSVWVKPVVDAVVTPAHAQTSTVFVVSGNAVVTVTKAGFAQSRSVLDMFIDSAHATALPNFEGACVTMSGDTVTTFNFTDQGVTVSGAYNPATGSAS